MAEAEPSSSNPNNPIYDVDTSNHARGLWLLKVPKYLAEKWDTSEDGTDIGQIEFVKKPNSTAQNIIFRVSEESVNSGNTNSDHGIPLSHTLKMSPCDNVSMLVFSQNKEGVKIEGKIAQRADIQVDASYMNQYMSLKRKKIETTEASKKKKYEPIMLHSNPNKVYSTKYKEISKRKRERQEEKHLRSDKQIVLDRVFDAFKKIPFYNTSDLVKITRQPQNHLKEILKGVCKYRTHAPHKNMWELKPEYKDADSEKESDKVTVVEETIN